MGGNIKENRITIAAMILCAKEEPYIHLTLQSLLGIVDTVYIQGDWSKETLERIDSIDKFADFKIVKIWREWDGDYGLARRELKNLIKEDWILSIDADEILGDEGLSLREIAKSEDNIYHLTYQHFIWNFQWLDDTYNPHVGLGRFYRNIKEVQYPKGLHEYAQELGKNTNEAKLLYVTLWHLGYTKGLDQIRKKYEMNLRKSPIHSKEYLDSWYNAHMLGTYKVRQVTKNDIDRFPAVLRRWLNVRP